MSEKLTGADHTKLDDQFTQMEKITDVFLEVEVGDNIRPSLWLNIQMSSQLASLSKTQGLFATHSVFCSDGDVRENPWYSVSEPRGASQASLRQGNSFHWSKLLSYLVSRVVSRVNPPSTNWIL